MQTGRKSLLTNLRRGIAWTTLALVISIGGSGLVRAEDPEVSISMQEIIAPVIGVVMQLDQTVAGIRSAVDAFEESFSSKRISTRQLCLSDESGAETCITKADLDAFLSTRKEAHARADADKSAEPAPTPVEQDALTQSTTAPAPVAASQAPPAETVAPQEQADDHDVDATGSVTAQSSALAPSPVEAPVEETPIEVAPVETIPAETRPIEANPATPTVDSSDDDC
jgi:hypothetical protein